MAGFIEVAKKELRDNFSSKRFYILFFLIFSIGLMISCFSFLKATGGLKRIGDQAIFLKFYTSIPNQIGLNFVQFLSIFGPVFGFGLTFDSISEEVSKGTLYYSLSQPIHRDSLINGKAAAGILTITIFLVTTIFSVVGMGIFGLKMPLPMGELFRIFLFTVLSLVYISFWSAIGVLFSTLFNKSATSALGSVAVWLFCSVFINMFERISNVAGLSFSSLVQLSPTFLYQRAAMPILMPKARFFGVAQAKTSGAIPNPLTLYQSLSVIWPELIGLITGTLLLFLASYWKFMREEIRPS